MSLMGSVCKLLAISNSEKIVHYFSTFFVRNNFIVFNQHDVIVRRSFVREKRFNMFPEFLLSVIRFRLLKIFIFSSRKI